MLLEHAQVYTVIPRVLNRYNEHSTSVVSLNICNRLFILQNKSSNKLRVSIFVFKKINDFPFVDFCKKNYYNFSIFTFKETLCKFNNL